jgi:hypothetical protein
MQIAAKRNLVLTTVSSLNSLGGTYQAVRQGELYQPIVWPFIKRSHRTCWTEVGNRLIIVAEHALNMRQPDVVDQASQILLNSPLPREYHNIGQYYRAMSIKRTMGSTAARGILEDVAESQVTPLRYRARALQAIGIIHHDNGDLNEGLRFFLKAGCVASEKHGRDLLTVTLSQWMIAVIKSIKGDNRGALLDLERLSSPVRLLSADQPFILYSYSNSLAVEFLELGRIEEAQNASRIALASPFADKYPEFSETDKDISQKARRASHSIVAITRPRFDFDVPAQTGDEAVTAFNAVVPIGRDFFETDPHLQQDEDAGVVAQAANDQEKIDASSHSLNFKEPVSFLPFPNRFASSSDSEKATQSSSISALHFFRLSVGQKRSLVIEVAKQRRTSGEILDKMLKAAGVIGLDEEEKPVYKPKTINLEHRSFLEELVSLWVEGEVCPDDFAAVISALRNCDDAFRRNNILDQMISYSFRATPERIKAEDRWRNSVEINFEADSENEALLEEKISLWMQGEINPEDFAAVLYALRDCQDDQRLNQMLDQMIGYAYRQIHRPLEGESEWRKRVEASLAPPQGQD